MFPSSRCTESSPQVTETNPAEDESVEATIKVVTTVQRGRIAFINFRERGSNGWRQE
jgi:hypothetical protein